VFEFEDRAIVSIYEAIGIAAEVVEAGIAFSPAMMFDPVTAPEALIDPAALIALLVVAPVGAATSRPIAVPVFAAAHVGSQTARDVVIVAAAVLLFSCQRVDHRLQMLTIRQGIGALSS